MLLFVRQKTAHEMLRSLVGSEKCIKDRERDTPEMRAVKKKELEKYPLARRCWKGYDHDLLNKLSEEGLINAAGRTYPALITPEGEAEARKLLAQYGIDTEERRRCSAER